MSSDKYCGAVPWLMSNIKVHSLNWNLLNTGNQWSWFRKGVACVRKWTELKMAVEVQFASVRRCERDFGSNQTILDTEHRCSDWNWRAVAVRQYSPRLASPERVACRSIHRPTKCKRHGCQVVGRVIATTRVQSNASLLIYGRPRPKLISVSYADPRWRNVWPISVARRRQRRLQKHKTAASYAHSDDDATKRNPSPSSYHTQRLRQSWAVKFLNK